MVEQLGADTLVHIGHGTGTIIARLPHGLHPDLGSTMHLVADPSTVFLFDSATGTRIR
jgi:ABC-type sugar transport system ATPase subunit